ncbi:DUF805 domain-containing protein [Anaerobiospirillum sp. NML120449]|uniref:DUF805 domain-containing protein n=1 Tax=Anaerobiospirillum sp. NML120449 TaxID=2932817 RepID=UPI001FF53921|nr:DUF805 domain-containing protein [Anaerobiospirillum sp. NML120449]MCK0525802.1 DUF805 domain-containing protein [Anaerobiospirillum sp. NML120449]
MKEALISCAHTNTCNASGRASRSEFWWFALCCLICTPILAFITVIPLFGIFMCVMMSLPLMWMLLLAFIRRLHDLNKSALHLLIMLAPLGLLIQFTKNHIVSPASVDYVSTPIYVLAAAAHLYMLYLAVKPGIAGPNRYGPDPLAVAATARAAAAARDSEHGAAPAAPSAATPATPATPAAQAHAEHPDMSAASAEGNSSNAAPAAASSLDKA